MGGAPSRISYEERKVRLRNLDKEKKKEIGIVGVKELILRHENSSLKKELESATEEIRLKSLKIDIKEKGIKENNDILDDDLTIIGIGK
mgnify:CR=1 FL=1